ncbi:MAG TPA: pentapeptide repeat-containing protein [Mycobacterium sp.]|nr:pentapeptide repeat-containing protein [Mycobacterium sp.]
MTSLRKFTPDELRAILDAHKKWRRGEVAGVRADLSRADLAGANLAGANLADADLADANLAGADLADADLAGAYLAGANLAGANLARANLARADRSETDPPAPYVRGAVPDYAARAKQYRERHPEVPVVEALDRKILDVVTAGAGKLEMGNWHTCDTTHCRGGWAIHLAGVAGAALENEHGVETAARMIYRASTGRVPHFYASNERALEDIKRCAGVES